MASYDRLSARDLCSNCGMLGRHATLLACIEALRSELADGGPSSSSVASGERRYESVM